MEPLTRRETTKKKSKKSLETIDVGKIYIGVKPTKVRRKGRNVVRIINEGKVKSLMTTSFDEVPVFCSPPEKECKPVFGVSSTTVSILDTKTLHSYLCSCSKLSLKCRDSTDIEDLEVRRVRRMVADLEEREDDVVRKGFLPLIHDLDHRQLRKRELQHKRWTERVYNPLHAAVHDELHGRRYNNTRVTRSLMYGAYLEHRNTRDIFLNQDISRPALYPHGRPDRHWLHARIPPLADPTLTASRKDRKEERVLEVYDRLAYTLPWLPPIYDRPSYMSVSW